MLAWTSESQGLGGIHGNQSQKQGFHLPHADCAQPSQSPSVGRERGSWKSWGGCSHSYRSFGAVMLSVGQSRKLTCGAACPKGLTVPSKCTANINLFSHTGTWSPSSLVFPKVQVGGSTSKRWSAPAWAPSPFLFGKPSLFRASFVQTPFSSQEGNEIHSIGCLPMLTQTRFFPPNFILKCWYSYWELCLSYL